MVKITSPKALARMVGKYFSKKPNNERREREEYHDSNFERESYDNTMRYVKDNTLSDAVVRRTDLVGYDITSPNGGKKIGVNLIKVGPDGSGSDTEYFERAIVELLEKGSQEILLAPEYNFLPITGPVTENEKADMLNRLVSASNGKDTLLFPGTIVWKDDKGKMHNTAPVIYDGELLLEYDKMRDGGEAWIASRHQLTPNYGDKQGTFTWKGSSCGLEICADHAYSVLKDGNINDLDFHFIVSCGMDIHRDKIAAKKGGYVMICDGGRFKKTKITQVAESHLVEVSPN